MKYPRLIDVSDGTEKNPVEVNSEKFSIGRSLHNSLVIENTAVSRNHCNIELQGTQWTILDKSTNGTRVNTSILGKTKRCNLQHGDIIILCDDSKFKFDYSAALTEDDGFVAAADAALQSAAQPPAPKQEPPGTSKLEEDDLTCSVCTELFVEAVTLECSHTFCKFCIEQWRKNHDVCPICRNKIKGLFPTLIVNNLVEKYLAECSEEDKTRRKKVIEERGRSQTSTVADNICSSTTIEIGSDDSLDEEEEEDLREVDGMYTYAGDVLLLSDWEEDYENDDYSDYNGLPGAYYGGYGTCYSCGERGHWSNGCPYNPRRRRH